MTGLTQLKKGKVCSAHFSALVAYQTPDQRTKVRTTNLRFTLHPVSPGYDRYRLDHSHAGRGMRLDSAPILPLGELGKRQGGEDSGGGLERPDPGDAVEQGQVAIAVRRAQVL